MTTRTPKPVLVRNDRALWSAHALGPPNRSTQAVVKIGNHLFALGRYNQFADDAILSITRHLTSPGHVPASQALAILRRYVRTHWPGILALQTYTDPSHQGTSYRADGWVYVASHKGQRRWLRSI